MMLRMHALAALLLVMPIAALGTDQPQTQSDSQVRAAAANKARPARDRLQLDSTAITGNRELPKVMSIVPWKEAEPPGGPDRPMSSLVEEVLAPIDRHEFQREIAYYRDLTLPRSPDQTKPSPGVTQQ